MRLRDTRHRRPPRRLLEEQDDDDDYFQRSSPSAPRPRYINKATKPIKTPPTKRFNPDLPPAAFPSLPLDDRLRPNPSDEVPEEGVPATPPLPERGHHNKSDHQKGQRDHFSLPVIPRQIYDALDGETDTGERVAKEPRKRRHELLALMKRVDDNQATRWFNIGNTGGIPGFTLTSEEIDRANSILAEMEDSEEEDQASQKISFESLHTVIQATIIMNIFGEACKNSFNDPWYPVQNLLDVSLEFVHTALTAFDQYSTTGRYPRILSELQDEFLQGREYLDQNDFPYRLLDKFDSLSPPYAYGSAPGEGRIAPWTPRATNLSHRDSAYFGRPEEIPAKQLDAVFYGAKDRASQYARHDALNTIAMKRRREMERSNGSGITPSSRLPLMRTILPPPTRYASGGVSEMAMSSAVVAGRSINPPSLRHGSLLATPAPPLSIPESSQSQVERTTLSNIAHKPTCPSPLAEDDAISPSFLLLSSPIAEQTLPMQPSLMPGDRLNIENSSKAECNMLQGHLSNTANAGLLSLAGPFSTGRTSEMLGHSTVQSSKSPDWWQNDMQQLQRQRTRMPFSDRVAVRKGAKVVRPPNLREIDRPSLRINGTFSEEDSDNEIRRPLPESGPSPIARPEKRSAQSPANGASVAPFFRPSSSPTPTTGSRRVQLTTNGSPINVGRSISVGRSHSNSNGLSTADPLGTNGNDVINVSNWPSSPHQALPSSQTTTPAGPVLPSSRPLQAPLGRFTLRPSPVDFQQTFNVAHGQPSINGNVSEVQASSPTTIPAPLSSPPAVAVHVPWVQSPVHVVQHTSDRLSTETQSVQNPVPAGRILSVSPNTSSNDSATLPESITVKQLAVNKVSVHPGSTSPTETEPAQRPPSWTLPSNVVAHVQCADTGDERASESNCEKRVCESIQRAVSLASAPVLPTTITSAPTYVSASEQIPKSSTTAEAISSPISGDFVTNSMPENSFGEENVDKQMILPIRFANTAPKSTAAPSTRKESAHEDTLEQIFVGNSCLPKSNLMGLFTPSASSLPSALAPGYQMMASAPAASYTHFEGHQMAREASTAQLASMKQLASQADMRIPSIHGDPWVGPSYPSRHIETTKQNKDDQDWRQQLVGYAKFKPGDEMQVDPIVMGGPLVKQSTPTATEATFMARSTLNTCSNRSSTPNSSSDSCKGGNGPYYTFPKQASSSGDGQRKHKSQPNAGNKDAFSSTIDSNWASKAFATYGARETAKEEWAIDPALLSSPMASIAPMAAMMSTPAVLLEQRSSIAGPTVSEDTRVGDTYRQSWIPQQLLVPHGRPQDRIQDDPAPTSDHARQSRRLIEEPITEGTVGSRSSVQSISFPPTEEHHQARQQLGNSDTVECNEMQIGSPLRVTSVTPVVTSRMTQTTPTGITVPRGSATPMTQPQIEAMVPAAASQPASMKDSSMGAMSAPRTPTISTQATTVATQASNLYRTGPSVDMSFISPRQAKFTPGTAVFEIGIVGPQSYRTDNICELDVEKGEKQTSVSESLTIPKPVTKLDPAGRDEFPLRLSSVSSTDSSVASNPPLEASSNEHPTTAPQSVQKNIYLQEEPNKSDCCFELTTGKEISEEMMTAEEEVSISLSATSAPTTGHGLGPHSAPVSQSTPKYKYLPGGSGGGGRYIDVNTGVKVSREQAMGLERGFQTPAALKDTDVHHTKTKASSSRPKVANPTKPTYSAGPFIDPTLTNSINPASNSTSSNTNTPSPILGSSTQLEMTESSSSKKYAYVRRGPRAAQHTDPDTDESMSLEEAAARGAHPRSLFRIRKASSETSIPDAGLGVNDKIGDQENDSMSRSEHHDSEEEEQEQPLQTLNSTAPSDKSQRQILSSIALAQQEEGRPSSAKKYGYIRSGSRRGQYVDPATGDEISKEEAAVRGARPRGLYRTTPRPSAAMGAAEEDVSIQGIGDHGDYEPNEPLRRTRRNSTSSKRAECNEDLGAATGTTRRGLLRHQAITRPTRLFPQQIMPQKVASLRSHASNQNTASTISETTTHMSTSVGARRRQRARTLISETQIQGSRLEEEDELAHVGGQQMPASGRRGPGRPRKNA